MPIFKHTDNLGIGYAEAADISRYFAEDGEISPSKSASVERSKTVAYTLSPNFEILKTPDSR
jgi:hypothetical protein